VNKKLHCLSNLSSSECILSFSSHKTPTTIPTRKVKKASKPARTRKCSPTPLSTNHAQQSRSPAHPSWFARFQNGVEVSLQFLKTGLVEKLAGKRAGVRVGPLGFVAFSCVCSCSVCIGSLSLVAFRGIRGSCVRVRAFRLVALSGICSGSIGVCSSGFIAFGRICSRCVCIGPLLSVAFGCIGSGGISVGTLLVTFCRIGSSSVRISANSECWKRNYSMV
jgi:hypothetical protein